MILRRSKTAALGRAACVLVSLAVALGSPHLASAAKIACVGDSITFGYKLSDPSTQSYPAVLGARLGSSDTVQNFGVSGTTLLKSGDKPYWNEANFTASTSFAPDVVIIMLGTNDSKPQNWSNKAEFSPDYLDLIAHYRSLGALVYVATPPPVYPPGADGIPPDVVANEVVPLVETIAAQASAPLVDVFTALSGKPDDFPDTVHPNAAGAALLADTVQASLEKYGLGGAGAMAGAGGMVSQAGAGGAGMAAGAGDVGAGGRANAGGGGAPSSAGASSAGSSSSGGVLGAGGVSASAAGASAGETTSSSGGLANPAQAGSTASAAGGASAVSTSGGAPGASGVGRAGAAPVGAGTSAAGAEAGHAGAAGSESSGCGCRASRSRTAAPLAMLFAVALGAFRRRRRRSN